MKTTEITMGQDSWMWIQDGTWFRKAWLETPNYQGQLRALGQRREVKDGGLQISKAQEETEAYSRAPAGRGRPRSRHSERELPAPA